MMSIFAHNDEQSCSYLWGNLPSASGKSAQRLGWSLGKTGFLFRCQRNSHHHAKQQAVWADFDHQAMFSGGFYTDRRLREGIIYDGSSYFWYLEAEIRFHCWFPVCSDLAENFRISMNWKARKTDLVLSIWSLENNNLLDKVECSHIRTW